MCRLARVVAGLKQHADADGGAPRSGSPRWQRRRALQAQPERRGIAPGLDCIPTGQSRPVKACRAEVSVNRVVVVLTVSA